MKKLIRLGMLAAVFSATAEDSDFKIHKNFGTQGAFSLVSFNNEVYLFHMGAECLFMNEKIYAQVDTEFQALKKSNETEFSSMEFNGLYKPGKSFEDAKEGIEKFTGVLEKVVQDNSTTQQKATEFKIETEDEEIVEALFGKGLCKSLIERLNNEQKPDLLAVTQQEEEE